MQPLTSDDPNVKKGLDLLKPWDARDAADSAAAAVFEVWIANHLGPVLLKTTAPKAADLIAPEASSISALVAYLESPDASFGADPAAARDQILRDSLGAAVADVAGKLGPDASTWRWGRLHVAKFDHALMPLADKATAAQLSVGPLAYGGAANVPRAATYRRADYQLFAGASFRMVLDVRIGMRAAPSTRPANPAIPSAPIIATSLRSGPRANMSRCSTAARPSKPRPRKRSF
ncbi:acyl-homoserine lactone acylase PvdQ [Bradyrhizobium sp. S3.2.12]